MGMLDTLMNLVAPAQGQIASRLGESESAVSRGLPLVLATMLGGVLARTQDRNAGTKLFDFISNSPASADVNTSDIALSDTLTGASTSGTATSFMNMLFGSRSNVVGDLVSRAAGLQNTSSGSALLSLASPVVLGFLGNKIRTEKLNSDGFANAFAGERDSILAAAPPGLMDALNAPARETQRPVEERRYDDTVEHHASVGGRRWVWPLVAVAAVALVWFATAKRFHVRRTVETAAGTYEGATPGGPLVLRTLPGGERLNIRDNSTEGRMLAFIEDASRPVSDTAWLIFDRVNFAPGSANLLPESKEQLDHVATVMKAYPAVAIKVGGFTDNIGDPAQNMRLSRERADAVKSAIVADGIDGNRLQTEGYGETHAVATNTTEQGRAQNRRIALLVVRK